MEQTSPTDSPAPQPVPMQPASAPSSTSAAATAAGSEAPPSTSSPPSSAAPYPDMPPPTSPFTEVVDFEDFCPAVRPENYSLDEFRWVAVRRKPRLDGWTEEKQRRFIETLADTGLVGAAAKAVGMTRESAYKLRRSAHATAFARAWDAARHHAGSFLEDMAFERALEGVEHNVFDENGEVVCTKRVYNDRLLTYLLSHLKPERYGRMAQLLGAQAQLAQVQTAQVQTAQVQTVQSQIAESQIAEPQIAEPPIAEAQITEAQITGAGIDNAPNPGAPVAQDENALVAIVQPANAPALIEQVHSAPPVSLDALLREMEPQMPAPPEEFLDRETLGHELMMADMYDGELPPHFREQRRVKEKTAEQLKSEALAAKYARGEAIYNRQASEPDDQKSTLSHQEADDLYFYMDPTSRNSPGRKRFR